MGIFGFGKKKTTAGTIFSAHYKSLLASAKQLPDVSNVAFELLPAMFVICDYATASAKKDRAIVADTILAEIIAIRKTFSSEKAIFDSRVDLYGMVLRGLPPRGEWLMGNTQACHGNPIMTIATVFGDILYNPDCATNYAHAPFLLKGIFECMGFSAAMKPVVTELGELFKEIYDL